MNLITFSFEIQPDNQADFVKSFDELRPFWKNEEITVSLFRDSTKVNKFFLIFLCEKGIDDITKIIQMKPEAKTLFAAIKEMKGSLSVSCFEQVL